MVDEMVGYEVQSWSLQSNPWLASFKVDVRKFVTPNWLSNCQPLGLRPSPSLPLHVWSNDDMTTTGTTTTELQEIACSSWLASNWNWGRR